MSQTIDKQIFEYLPLLGNEEKKSILTVIKSFLHLKQDNQINIEQYNKEIDEALLQIKNGEFLSQEDLEEESKTW
ncbi:MAG: hypothetical protein U0U67_07860 [Chitinophagales bacterium]